MPLDRMLNLYVYVIRSLADERGRHEFDERMEAAERDWNATQMRRDPAAVPSWWTGDEDASAAAVKRHGPVRVA